MKRIVLLFVMVILFLATVAPVLSAPAQGKCPPLLPTTASHIGPARTKAGRDAYRAPARWTVTVCPKARYP